MVKLPDSPEDRKVRDEAIAVVLKRLAIAAGPLLLVGAFAHALGVPWILVLLALVAVLYVVLFEA